MSTYTKYSPRVLETNVAVSTGGKQTRVTYFAPLHRNDRKRIGSELTINVGKASITLDGTGRRVLEAALKQVRKAEKAYDHAR
jgi:hypothetical protein